MYSLTPVLLPFSTKPPAVTRVVPEVPAPITARAVVVPPPPVSLATTPSSCGPCTQRAVWIGGLLVVGGLLWWCLKKG